MLEMKYIIGNIPGKNGIQCDGPIIFPSWCDHKETATKMNITDIRSAGFVRVIFGKVVCYGESVSLDKESNPEFDQKVIDKFICK